MRITVPPQAWSHFWEEPPPGSEEFWAFRWPQKVKPGDVIEFVYRGETVASAFCSRVEKPGESKCARTGDFENRWKVFWAPESFQDMRKRQ